MPHASKGRPGFRTSGHAAAATLMSFILLSVLALPGAPANAATLGKLTIHSGVAEPLRGEIAVSVPNAKRLDSLAARLASREAYEKAGLQYSKSLEMLKFTLGKGAAGQHVIKVASAASFNEPILDLLVELAWFEGGSAYGYTALINPAGPAVAQGRAMPQFGADAAPRARKVTRKAGVAKASASRKARDEAERRLAEQVRVKEEQAVARQQKLTEARQRIAELEKTLEDQQRLLQRDAAAPSVVRPQSANPARPPEAGGTGIVRISLETGGAAGQQAARQTARAPGHAATGVFDAVLSEPLHLAGGASGLLLAALLVLRQRRLRSVSQTQRARVAPRYRSLR
jgi:hypothetical protein